MLCGTKHQFGELILKQKLGSILTLISIFAVSTLTFPHHYVVKNETFDLCMFVCTYMKALCCIYLQI